MISEIFLKKPNWADTDGGDSGVMWCAFGGTCSRKEPIATDRPGLKTTRCPGPSVPLPLPWGSRPGSRLTASWAPAKGARRNFLATSDVRLETDRHQATPHRFSGLGIGWNGGSRDQAAHLALPWYWSTRLSGVQLQPMKDDGGQPHVARLRSLT